MQNFDRTPRLYQRLWSKDTTDGRQRRCFAIYSSDGRLLDCLEEDSTKGLPGWARGLAQLPIIYVSVAEYSRFLERGAMESNKTYEMSLDKTG